MSYLGISVKEAINNVNNGVSGWFLPAIQRPYVWGSRYEHELYICKLFDSILKGYPIGSLIIWSTKETIPYREFITNYPPEAGQKIVDVGLHSRPDKSLVYDGQQRLQTLFSCLKYTFNKRILIYDLLFDLSNTDDPDNTGFKFVPKNTKLEWNFIRLNELFSKLPDDDKRAYRKSIIDKYPDISDRDEELIEKNIDNLWDFFVKTGEKALAYYEIETSSKTVVNEVFERLNTGGMALALTDLLFSKIKAKYPDFEERLQECSNKIYNSTGNGYIFSANNILQLINLIIKKAVRIDHKKVHENEITLFNETWDNLEAALLSFFSDYLWGQFKINNASIVPRKLALLPIIYYFYELFNKGFSFKDITGENLMKINQYFIKSQINDWSLQSYSDNFTRIIRETVSASNTLFEFPLEEIESYISEKKQRNIETYEQTFVDYVWFALKILTPTNIYQFDPNMQGRFNPEIDHIFPKKLKDSTSEYEQSVDIIWNMQPTKGDINGFKTNFHPKDFFSDTATDKKGNKIIGSKYLDEYSFVPDINSGSWLNPVEFIEGRRTKMINFLNKKYKIIFKDI